jgi:hypothetical protein
VLFFYFGFRTTKCCFTRYGLLLHGGVIVDVVPRSTTPNDYLSLCALELPFDLLYPVLPYILAGAYRWQLANVPDATLACIMFYMERILYNTILYNAFAMPQFIYKSCWRNNIPTNNGMN